MAAATVSRRYERGAAGVSGERGPGSAATSYWAGRLIVVVFGAMVFVRGYSGRTPWVWVTGLVVAVLPIAYAFVVWMRKRGRGGRFAGRSGHVSEGGAR